MEQKRKRPLRLILSGLMLMLGISAFAQKQTVRGTVKDSHGDPVMGATVILDGKSAAVTDIDGVFTIEAQKDQKVEVRSVGFKPATKAVGGAALEVVLQEDGVELENIVVVGYATQKKANLTGSVASIDAKELEARPINNVQSALQGMMPGVTITGTNGAPGMDAGSIRVRGTGTLNSASPYILVDGVETGTLSSIDPNDIESISVLKDAASAAIYGSKASNGVILVTTKGGGAGKPKITYNGSVSFQNATNMIERLSSADYAEMYNYALQADGKAARFSEEEIQKFRDGTDPAYPNTDWYGLAYKTGALQRHNVNISGGNQYVRYMASAGYLKQDGILPNAGREQFNGRTNLSMDINDHLTARLNMAYTKNAYDDASSAYAGGSSDQLVRQLNLIAPWIPARNADGTWGSISDGNPIAWIDNGIKVSRDNRNFSGLLGLDWKIADGLTATANASFVANTQDYNYFQPYFRYNADKATDPSQLTNTAYQWDRKTFEALLNYGKTFGREHNFKAMLGWHAEGYSYKELKAFRKNFPLNILTDMDAGEKSSQANEGYTRQLNMLSYFGRVNYDYAGRYLLEANLRADASSRFADGHRWGYFPSFSAGWRISEEAFAADHKGWLNNLKLRASWGMLGNQDALDEYYPAINTYSLDTAYPIGGALKSGYVQSGYKLATISWEKATTWGVGLDFAFINKIFGSIDYYNRKTSDIIMKMKTPKEFALGDYYDNIGSMRNSGVELSVQYNDKWGDWTFGAGANFAYNNNEILALTPGTEFIETGYNQRNAPGHAFNTYYVYKSDGFFQSDQEAAEFTEKYGNPFGKQFRAGDIRYVDVDGNGKLDSDDRYYADSSEPVYTFALNLTAGYKGFDISAFFNGAAGMSRYFDAHEVYGNFSGDAAHPATIWKDAWSETNKGGSMPRIFESTNSPSSSRTAVADFWLEDCSYLRLKNLQVGYTFGKALTAKAGIDNLRVYYSVENLFTLDGMRINIDPEATSQRLSSYPLLRTHAIGLSITF